MCIKKDTPKWKIHLLFASLLPLAFLLDFVIRLLFGGEINEAALDALKQFNLVLIIYYFALWYCVATGKLQREGERKSNIITLNLNDK